MCIRDSIYFALTAESFTQNYILNFCPCIVYFSLPHSTVYFSIVIYFLLYTGETLCESLSRDMRGKRRLWNENCCCSTKWWCSTYCKIFLFSLLIECWTKNDEMFGTVLCPLIKKRKWKSDIVLSDKVFLFFHSFWIELQILMGRNWFSFFHLVSFLKL